MAKIRVIKKNDDYSMDYQVGDILEVTGTWYGGINVNSKTGIPLCLDKDEYEEIPENTDLSHEEYERAANYWKEKDAQSKKLDQDVFKKGPWRSIFRQNNTCALATTAGDLCAVRRWSIRIMTTASGFFLKVARSFMRWKRTKMICHGHSLDKYEGIWQCCKRNDRSQAWHLL